MHHRLIIGLQSTWAVSDMRIFYVWFHSIRASDQGSQSQRMMHSVSVAVWCAAWQVLGGRAVAAGIDTPLFRR